mmetsp:Transcript_5690/g.18314  ORF Transcript_5690/g.18314 Transcript_5690/m.18314 type:complete len:439 (-) Transcript_5690:2197-3513(-)
MATTLPQGTLTDGMSLLVLTAMAEAEDSLGHLSLGRIPPLNEHLKNSIGDDVFKLCGDSEWQPRCIVMTKQLFIISHPGSTQVSDQIPLFEIKSCARLAGQAQIEGYSIAFVIDTVDEGYNGGRQYVFAVENEEQLQSWTQAIKKQAAICFKQHRNLSIFEESQERARKILRTKTWQSTFSILIVGNFVVNICQTSAAPFSNQTYGQQNVVLFHTFDWAFTLLFSVELAMNLFGNWITPFFESNWNLFDFAIVTVSIVCVGYPSGPTWILLLRTLRLFRIIRLFRKLRVLRTIITAILASLPIVFNAFVLLWLVAMIYAVVGQNLFSFRSPKYFGQFDMALYTVFGLFTVGGWLEVAHAVKDPAYGPGDVDPNVALYFVSLVLICVWILVQVVSALLVDSFTQACRHEERRALVDDEEQRMRKRGFTKVPFPSIRLLV